MKKRNLIILGVLLIAVFLAFILVLKNPSITGKAIFEEDYKCPDCNVILISIDALRADHLGCYGYEKNTTPNIDKFAENAILFENAYSQSHNTIVSHATMLTSLYPAVHGVIEDTSLEQDLKTIAEYFKEKGYKTAAFLQHPIWLSRKRGFGQGFEHFQSKMISAEENNKHIFSWLKNNSNNQFFLFIHYFDVHADFGKLPYETKTKFDEKFIGDYNGNFTGCDEDNKVCADKYFWTKNRDLSAEDKEYVISLYDGGIAYTDYQIGKLLSFLKVLELMNNSVIIITSDHGEEFWEHGSVFHLSLYKEVTHVPIIIYIPNQKQKSRIKFPVGVIDIMPAILDISNINYENLQGQSLLSGETNIEKQLVFSTGFPRYGGYDKLFLRNNEWGLFVQNNFTKVTLYDLKEMPYETEDVSKEHIIIKQKLLNIANEFYISQEKIRGSLKVEAGKSLVSDEELEQLKALGYMN